MLDTSPISSSAIAPAGAPDPDEGRPLPAFPLHVLPPEWARWVDSTAARLNAPVDYVAMGLLASVAGVTGAGTVAEPLPDWREPLVLWQCAVGRPGAGKSIGLAAGRRLLEAVEQGEEEDKADGVRKNVPQRLLDEATPRALAGVVSRNPNGVVLWQDELADWLPGRGPARAAWQKAWPAEPVVANRGAAAARQRLAAFPVSVVGGLTPANLACALKGAGDGLAGRFLYAWPARPGWRPFKDRPRKVQDEGFVRRLRQLADLAGTPGEPRVLRFDADAAAAFERFCAQWHDAAREHEGPLAHWLGRGASTVARLAGMLRLLAWSEGKLDQPFVHEVHVNSVEKAAALWSDYLRPHAEAALGLAARGPGELPVRRVVRWLEATKPAVVSREEVRAQALSRSVDARGADRVIAELEARGVLARETADRRGRGRPPVRW